MSVFINDRSILVPYLAMKKDPAPKKTNIDYDSVSDTDSDDSNVIIIPKKPMVVPSPLNQNPNQQMQDSLL
jgi:hypothetical protein